MTELAAWLDGIGLGQYAKVLIENDVDLETLPHLSDADLLGLGLSLGHRRKLIAAIAETPPEAPAAAHSIEAERRQLTVVFCDLAGSTELSQRLDPEDLRALLGRYHDTVADVVNSHGGHVAKLLGDGVLAFFGWPNAHEDDADRAVRAALAALASVERIEDGGTNLTARAGIATGPVVIGDRASEATQEHGAVAGVTPNLAARLQAEAEPGGVVIHGATRRLIGEAFNLEEAGNVALKGFSDPVQIWRVSGIARSDSRFEAQHGAGLTEFIGRANEIGLIHDRWRLASRGEGQVLLLSGEAGIGKSRLLREFTESLAAEQCRLFRYQCSPLEINAAFHPPISEVESGCGVRSEDPVEIRLDRLDRHIAEVFSDGAFDETAALFAGLMGLPTDRYPPIEMAPQRRKQRVVTLLAERILSFVNGGPIILLVEDVHWIDPSTLEVLDAIVERIQDLPMFVIMTHRPEFETQWGNYGHVTAHSLNRLGRMDGRAIAARIANGKALPEEVLDHIVTQTDGVPLFVEELTKTVLEAGILEEQADCYALTGPMPALSIPATLQDSLMARIDRLAPVKRVVQAASCIGREFGTKLLSSALATTASDLDDALGQLLEAGLIFRQGDSGNEARYIFKHALVQDAAYASLLTKARRSLHERLVLGLEQTTDPDPLELARHLAEAGASGRAASLYLQAGRRALASNALLEAIGALELGINVLADMEPSRDCDRIELDIRVALGAARMANFGWAHPAVAEAMEPAFPLAKQFEDEQALGSILWALWVHYQTRTDFPRAREWLAELEMAASAKPDSDLPIVFDMSAGCQHFWEADYSRAIGHTDRLKSVYDPDKHSRITSLTNHDPLVFSLHWAGTLAEWIRGYPDRAIQRLEDAIPLARRIGHPFNLTFALTAGSTSLIYLGQTARMLSFCDEAERVVEEEALGQFALNVCVYQWRGAAQILRGAFEEGHALVAQGNAFWSGSGGGICTAMMRSWMVLGLQGLGSINEAIALNDSNIFHCRSSGDRYMEPECVRLRGELALAADETAVGQAERDFREAIKIANDHGARSWELRAAMSLARLLQSLDRCSEAIACLEPTYNWFVEGLDSEDLKQAKTLLSELA
ncbi:MAG: AAA family ATPase [Paracoccaceae bacterium]|nr:AAA family ATPase [Paracoccaceae bacterium]